MPEESLISFGAHEIKPNDAENIMKNYYKDKHAYNFFDHGF